MPTEQTTTTGRPSASVPTAGAARTSRRSRRGRVVVAGRRATHPTRSGWRHTRCRSHRSGTRRLRGWFGSSPLRCRRTVATTWATAASRGRSPWTWVKASRSCSPTPTARRGPVSRSSTTRTTSSPRTSPRASPCSTTTSTSNARRRSTSSAAPSFGGRVRGYGRRRDRSRPITVDGVDDDRKPERNGPASLVCGLDRVVDDDGQAIEAATVGPGQRVTEGAVRLGVGEEPAVPVDLGGRAAGDPVVRDRGRRGAGRLDEGSQLGGDQPRPASRLERVGAQLFLVRLP